MNPEKAYDAKTKSAGVQCVKVDKQKYNSIAKSFKESFISNYMMKAYYRYRNDGGTVESL